MSRVRGKDTEIEITVRSELHKRGYRFRKHLKDLPGTPDIVFIRAKVAVFIDGDFWHGYRFSTWKNTLSPFWIKKIEKNRKRDRNNFAKLRRMGWTPLRVWQHEIEKDLTEAVSKIISSIDKYYR